MPVDINKLPVDIIILLVDIFETKKLKVKLIPRKVILDVGLEVFNCVERLKVIKISLQFSELSSGKVYTFISSTCSRR